jgi:hypothetical protein
MEHEWFGAVPLARHTHVFHQIDHGRKVREALSNETVYLIGIKNRAEEAIVIPGQ